MPNDIIDAILDIQPDLTTQALEENLVPAEPSSPAPQEPAPIFPETTIDSDLNYSRFKLKQIIDSAQITLESAIAVAEETANPRAFEVVGTMIQSIVAANKELMLLHKTKADALKAGAETRGEAKPTGDITIEKAVFVGRAQDLLRQLKIARVEVDQEA
jgi:hypothetical protein